MTSPVAPDTPIAVPEFPALGDPSFNTKAYAWGSWVPSLATWITSAVSKAYQNALSAFESATASAASAAASDASADISMGSANFKGEWAYLTGPLNMPASVAHAGRFWLLLGNLADVTAATPGVSASWLSFDILLPVVPVNTPTFTAVSGKHYSLEYMGGPVTGTMPPYYQGSAVVVTVANDRFDNVLLRNSPTDSFMGITDDLTLVNPTTYSLRGLKNSWRGL